MIFFFSKFRDDSANGLTKCIIQFLNLKGHHVERINISGRIIDTRKTFTDVTGRVRTIGSTKWIKETGTINEPERLRMEFEEEKKAIANPFPIEVFPKPIQEIITATHTSLNFPIDFMGASMLNAISVAIGNTYKAEIKNGFDFDDEEY